MNERRHGLGRGLGALIPTAPVRDGRRPADVFFPPPPPPPPPTHDVPAPLPAHGGSTQDTTARPAAAQDTTARPAAAQDTAGELSGATAPDTRVGEPAVGPADPPPVPPATLVEIAPDRVRPNPRQPRHVFDEDELAELTASICEVGLLQPIVVRPVTRDDAGDHPTASDAREIEYELVMGERRLRAAQQAGLARIPAIVRHTNDDALLRDALLENLHRAGLNPLEEAAAYAQLLADFGCSHDELATRLGRSRPQISNTIRLLRLPPAVQRRLGAGVLSAGHARALLGLGDTAAQERLAHRIVAEGLSVRAVEEIVSVGMEASPAPREPRATAAPPPRLAELTAALANRLDTRVQATLGRRRGRLVVEFASMDDLERIMDALALIPEPAD